MVSFKLRLRHLCFTFVLSSIAISCCRGQGGGGGAGGGGAGGAGAGGAGGGAVVPGTQDAIQIVAQAALCFDNRPIINGCLQAMGINVNGNGNGATSTAAPPTPSSGIAGAPELAPAPAPAPAPGPSASMCQGPCFGQMMLMMNCVNGILSNIQGYSPGLMQGVQAIYQMACGNVGNGQGGGSGGGAGGGGTGGAGGGGTGGGSAGGAGGGGSTAGGGGGGTNASPNAAAGSHVAVSNLGEPTSSAGGPTASIMSGFTSMLITWTCIWLLMF